MKDRIKEGIVVFLSLLVVKYMATIGWLHPQAGGWLPDTRGDRIALLVLAAGIGFGIG